MGSHTPGRIDWACGKDDQTKRSRSSRNGGDNKSKGDRTIGVETDLEANREAGVSFFQKAGGLVAPTNADKIGFRLCGRHVSADIGSIWGTGERRRALR